MADNQSTNDSDISFANSEISMPRTVRFWLLILVDIPSTACSLFVLFNIFTDRKSLFSVKNHVLIVLLILGLGCQLVDIPFYLNFIVHSGVVPPYPSVCLIWWYIDIGMYNGGAIIMAWTALERHIIVYHDSWISTKRKRIISHYVPLIILIIYIIVFYIYAMYYFPCENTFDYTLPFCNGSPCYLSDPIIGMWDLIVNTAAPSLLEAAFSFGLLFRVIWQKCRSHMPIHWRKQRKLTIQLMSFSSLNLAFNFPLSLLSIAHLCGLPQNIGVEASQYFFFLCYFAILLFPFICFASIGDVKKKFLEQVLRRKTPVRRFTATVRPMGCQGQTMIGYNPQTMMCYNGHTIAKF